VAAPADANKLRGFGWMPTLHIARTLALWMIPAMAYEAVVTALVPYLPLPESQFGEQAAAAISVALGVLIVFRNNAAHDRWWEARKLWGQLINDSRNLALKARAHAEPSAEESGRLARLIAGFAEALRLHLHGVVGIRSVPGFESEPADFPHGPGYLAGLIHQLLDRWNRQGKLRDTVWMLDVHARALMDVCGACERIRNTPLASSYRALLRWGIALNILFTPWAVGPVMGWWGFPVLAIGFGFLLGIELTAEAVEDPFGREEDDLPLDAYCRTIETFVDAVLREPQPVPGNGPPNEPVGRPIKTGAGGVPSEG
jgi:ion channel-forming bestrophin family protein